MPLFAYIFGGITDSFNLNNTPADTESQINKQLIYIIILGKSIFLIAGLAATFRNLIAGEQSTKIKIVYFKKLLYQNTTWYDKRKVDEVSANFIDQISSLTTIF